MKRAKNSKFIWWVVCDKDNIPRLIYPDKDWAKDRVLEGGCFVSVDCKGENIWWVVARKDNSYPLLIYPEKERAESIAESCNSLLIPVSLTIGQCDEI